MPCFRIPRRHEVQEVTAVFGQDDTSSTGPLEEPTVSTKLNELEAREALEREDTTKPSRCSSCFKLLPLLSIQFLFCFSLSFTEPTILRIVSKKTSYILAC